MLRETLNCKKKLESELSKKTALRGVLKFQMNELKLEKQKYKNEIQSNKFFDLFQQIIGLNGKLNTENDRKKKLDFEMEINFDQISKQLQNTISEFEENKGFHEKEIARHIDDLYAEHEIVSQTNSKIRENLMKIVSANSDQNSDIEQLSLAIRAVTYHGNQSDDIEKKMDLIRTMENYIFT